MLGTERIVIVEDISQFSVLETIDGIRPMMENIIGNCKLNIVTQCEHQLLPYGATML